MAAQGSFLQRALVARFGNVDEAREEAGNDDVSDGGWEEEVVDRTEKEGKDRLEWGGKRRRTSLEGGAAASVGQWNKRAAKNRV